MSQYYREYDSVRASPCPLVGGASLARLALLARPSLLPSSCHSEGRSFGENGSIVPCLLFQLCSSDTRMRESNTGRCTCLSPQCDLRACGVQYQCPITAMYCTGSWCIIYNIIVLYSTWGCSYCRLLGLVGRVVGCCGASAWSFFLYY